MHKVFCYGTLVDDEVRNYVVGTYKALTKDALEGYQKSGLNIVESDITPIYVIGYTFDVNEEELQKLDFYEGVESGLYRRKEVTLVSGARVWIYQKCNPDQDITAFGYSG